MGRIQNAMMTDRPHATHARPRGGPYLGTRPHQAKPHKRINGGAELNYQHKAYMYV